MTALKATEQASLLGTFVPPGVIMPFGGATAPSGWLACNTATGISTTTYAALFAAIGYAWGNPGGGLFNLPNLRGRFPRGLDRVADGTAIDPDRTSRAASNAGGNINDNVGSVQGSAFNSHNHTVNRGDGQPLYFNSGAGGYSTPAVPLASIGDSGWQQAFYANASGGNETRSVNAYVNYIIKY